MSRKYRKQPVVIEAVKWTGLNFDEMRDFIDCEFSTGLGISGGNCLFIPTLEGEMEAAPDDWIIKGIQGEFYPCKPDIFLQTYERVKVGEYGWEDSDLDG